MAKEAPIGVKIISVLYYIGAGISLLGAIFMFFGGSFLSQYMLSSILGGAFVLLGFFMVGLAVLSYFIARDLWRLKNWARIIVIVFSALTVLGALTSITQGVRPIVDLLVSLAIGGYLAFSKEAKSAFA